MNDASCLVVIPARYNSGRFPGKPLALIAGISMIERVWRIAVGAVGQQNVIVATEDIRIHDHVLGFGGRAVITSQQCRNGTERVWEAVSKNPPGCNPQIIINLQGDAVLTPPWIVRELADFHLKNLVEDYVTAAVILSRTELDVISSAKQSGAVGTTLVVLDDRSRALYFSKHIIPFERNPSLHSNTKFLRHIGIYSYTRAGLNRWVELPESCLEQTEGLEQLRILENGASMAVVNVDYRGRTHCSVDAQADISKVEQIISREGELI